MKITIDIDCTPEEARRFMGLPDTEAMQKHFYEAMQSQFQNFSADMKPEDYISMWTEIGQKNMQAFQKMMQDQMNKTTGSE